MNKRRDFIDSRWTESQKMRYQNAKNELEKEQVLEEIQNHIENEDYQNQILRQNPQTNTQKPDNWEIISNESSDSLDIEQDSVKEEEQLQKEVQEGDQFEGYFQLILNVVLRRNQVDYLLMKHYYDNIIEGSFVRIHEPSFKRYVLAQIIGVVEGEKSYQLEQSQTYKLFKLQYAEIKEPKFRHITQVSNQKLEKQELVVWKKKCEENSISIPSKDFLLHKMKDIQDAQNTRLSDEQIRKRIIVTIDKWTTTKQNILYHDLPLYLNFLQNQIQTCQQTIDKVEEFIQEIQESYGDDMPTKQDSSKKIQFQRQQKEKQNEIHYLKEQLGKVKALIKNHQEKQLSKSQQPTQNNNLKAKNNLQDDAQVKINQQYIKQKDDQFIRKYEGLETIQGSENFKRQFLQIHSIELPIDQYIDNIILEES